MDILTRDSMLVSVGALSTTNPTFFREIKCDISVFPVCFFFIGLFVYAFMRIGWLGLIVNELSPTLF